MDIPLRASFYSASQFSEEIRARKFAWPLKRHTVLYRLNNNCFLGVKICKFFRFPAIDFHYNESKLHFGNATSLWIGGLILQILTTFTSAYSTFNVLIDRLIINKIRVHIIVNSKAPDQKSNSLAPDLPRTAFSVVPLFYTSEIVINVFLGVEKHKLI